MSEQPADSVFHRASVDRSGGEVEITGRSSSEKHTPSGGKSSRLVDRALSVSPSELVSPTSDELLTADVVHCNC